MRQALHIFRKDARRFAYQICALVVLTFVWAWMNIAQNRGDIPLNRYGAFAGMVLIIGWWYLVSLLVHQEPLTGDRQFWITRPYSRRSLVAAKSLFVLAFFNVPLLLAGFLILGASGYRPLAYLPNFLWMQLTFTAAVLALPAALAALTRTLVQFVLTVLGLIVGLMLLAAFNSAGAPGIYQSSGLAWATGVLLVLSCAAPSLAVWVVQLRTRNRLVSAGAGIALAVLMLSTDNGLSLELGTTVQSRMFPQNRAASLSGVVTAGAVHPDPKHPAVNGVTLAVPLRVVHVPPGETAAPEMVELTIETPAGGRWSSGWIPAASTEPDVFQVDPSPDGSFTWKQRVVVDRAFWERARTGPVVIRGTVYTMLFGRRSVRLQDEGVTRVPGDGQCSLSLRNVRAIDCLAPFHMPFSKVDGPPAPEPAGILPPMRLLSIWDSPLPADFGMNPLSAGPYSQPASEPEIFFSHYEPRAYIRRSISAANMPPAP
ncbi:MAG: hypothetical protein ABSG65_05190 [Bryobacteraceae bacterium]|jgi:hypothetical protein